MSVHADNGSGGKIAVDLYPLHVKAAPRREEALTTRGNGA
jgi:hypothetical protein